MPAAGDEQPFLRAVAEVALVANIDGMEGEAELVTLMTLHAAEKIDQGLDGARADISAIKVFVPAAYTRVVDRAIQVWGAAGVSNDLPLAGMYMGARTLRIADGPDEVHRRSIAKIELKRQAQRAGLQR